MNCELLELYRQYFGTTVISQNCIHMEVNNTLNSGNASEFIFLSKNIKIKM